MNNQYFPDDENGDVLRRMFEMGDDLDQPRIVDFCFAFNERSGALDFARAVDDREFEVCISFYTERDIWQAIGKRFMIPTHQDITAIEGSLTESAVLAGGQADGWGCMSVRKAN